MSARRVPPDRLLTISLGQAKPATATEAGGTLASTRLVSAARTGKTAKERLAPLMSSNTAEWYTPRHVLNAACDALGGRIDLDPCAESARSVPTTHHFTKAEDGLVHPWAGTVYMNPPYGRDIIKWTGRLRSEYDAGRVTAAVALLPARTETVWWAELRVDWLCLIRGRLSFSNGVTNAPFPSAAVYLGHDGECFSQAFSALGPLYRRVAG
jgi:phage N-6-adenine-methyltransferase